MQSKRIIAALIVLVVALVAWYTLPQTPRPALATTAAKPQSEVPRGVIRIGSISNEPAEEIGVFQPFADHLASRLGDVGIGHGEVVVAGDISSMAALIADDKIDLYLDSPFPLVAMQQLQDVRIIARRWKKGVGEYHSVLFALRESGIDDLDDLRGKVVAFEEPFSTASYLLPKASLMKHGYEVMEVQDKRASASPGKIGYVFSNDDENTIFWVLRGKVAAGGINNIKFYDLPKSDRDRFHIFHRTTPVPRQLVSVRSDLAGPLVGRVQRVLFDMHQTRDGRQVLAAFEKTAKFDEFDAQSSDIMAPITDLAQLIRSEVLGRSPGKTEP